MSPLNRKPRRGDRVGFGDVKASDGAWSVVAPECATATIVDVGDSIAWVRFDGADHPSSFIWRHPDGLNLLCHLEAP